MAPSKSSRAAVGDDHHNHQQQQQQQQQHKADSAATSKDKAPEGKPAPAKMRRGASQNSASLQVREPAAPQAPTSAPSRSSNAAEPHAPSISWSLFDRQVLHSYRREHQLSTPAAFASTFHHTVLSRPGSIGQHSPTMVRKLHAQRQSKDGLAKAVRKHFNALGIQENDVVVDLIYKIRSQKTATGGGPNRQQGITSHH
ncbi:hypothetical protein E4U41_003188 [Claviceps citrina]|nr:hypothetical protein E4U41_003188 [Claviceps citrina]